MHHACLQAAPYGRHAATDKAAKWGRPISQRAGHMVSDLLPGVPFFLAVYLLYAGLLPGAATPGGKAFSQVEQTPQRVSSGCACSCS
jgi:hypothetical protein